jgi:large subunit ribosomal protein L24
MAAPLSPELISSKGAKALPVRKGDTVRVMRGDHAGFEGKISQIDLKRYRIFLEGLTREKVDGTNIFVSVHPSKVMIKNLKLDDKWRKVIVERKKELELPKKEKDVAEKPPKKAAKAKEEKTVEEKAAVQEKPVKKAPKTAKKKVQKKPVAEKKKEEKQAEKEKKLKTAKKPQAKRKAASKTKGGT